MEEKDEQQQLAAIERMAWSGLPPDIIFSALGVEARRQESRAVAQALKKGRAQGVAAVAEALYQRALDGSVQAQLYFLKAWSAGPDPQHPGGEEGDIAASRAKILDRICQLAARYEADVRDEPAAGKRAG